MTSCCLPFLVRCSPMGFAIIHSCLVIPPCRHPDSYYLPLLSSILSSSGLCLSVPVLSSRPVVIRTTTRFLSFHPSWRHPDSFCVFLSCHPALPSSGPRRGSFPFIHSAVIRTPTRFLSCHPLCRHPDPD